MFGDRCIDAGFLAGAQTQGKKDSLDEAGENGVIKKERGLGFRDFHCFNKALLAKQIWRLWKNPNSLIAEIIKAKYHPNESVLEANLGKKPSFAWRSIVIPEEFIRMT
jgi:hypothetical protein